MAQIPIKETDIWFYYDRDDAQASRNHGGMFIKGYWINPITGQRAVSNMTYNMGNTSAWKEEMRSFNDHLYDGWGTGPFGFVTGLKQLMKKDREGNDIPRFDQDTGYPIIDSDCGKKTKKIKKTKKRLEGDPNAKRKCDQFNSYSASDARKIFREIEDSVTYSPPTDDDDDDGSLFGNFKGPLKNETLV